MVWNGGLGPSYRFSARELNGSTGAEHLDDANFIKLCVGPFRGSDGWPRKFDLSKAFLLLVSGVVSAAVAVAGVVTGMAGQLLKAAASTLLIGIFAVVLVIVAVAAIILLSGCGPTGETGASPVAEQTASPTATPAPTAAASTPTATDAPAADTPVPTATSSPASVEPTPEPEYRIVTLLPPDAIPAISDPSFVSADEADDQYENDELVLGVEIDGDARAYSIPLLSRHEIVNDVVGGKPIAVTW